MLNVTMRHCVAVFIQFFRAGLRPRWAPAALALALLGAGLQALSPAHAGQLMGSVTLASHYKSDGIDENTKVDRSIDPTLQTFLMYAFDNGLYVGNWNSSTNADPNTSLEAVLLAGYMVPFGPGMVDVGVFKDMFPGASYLDTWRVYAAYEAYGFKLRYVRTTDGTHFSVPDGNGTSSIKLEYKYPVNERLTLQAAIGRSFYAKGLKNYGLPNSVFHQAGLEYTFPEQWTFGAVLDGASPIGSQSLGYSDKTRLIVSIKKSF